MNDYTKISDLTINHCIQIVEDCLDVPMAVKYLKAYKEDLLKEEANDNV